MDTLIFHKETNNGEWGKTRAIKKTKEVSIKTPREGIRTIYKDLCPWMQADLSQLEEMASFSGLKIGLSLVFGCLPFVLVAELYYLLWWKKRSFTSDVEDEFTNYVKGSFISFFGKRVLLLLLHCKPTILEKIKGIQTWEIKNLTLKPVLARFCYWSRLEEKMELSSRERKTNEIIYTVGVLWFNHYSW